MSGLSKRMKPREVCVTPPIPLTPPPFSRQQRSSSVTPLPPSHHHHGTGVVSRFSSPCAEKNDVVLTSGPPPSTAGGCVVSFFNEFAPRIDEFVSHIDVSHEIEFRLMTTSSTTYLPEDRISHILHSFQRSSHLHHNYTVLEQTIDIDNKSNIRRVTCSSRNGVPYFERKMRLKNIDIPSSSLRISHSVETPLTETQATIEDDFNPTLHRKRKRYCFKLSPPHSNVRYDISEYTDPCGEKTYEIEGEIVDMSVFLALASSRHRAKFLCDIVCKFLGDMCVMSLAEKMLVKTYVNALNIRPAQPVPLEMSRLVNTPSIFRGEYAITPKIDGMRKLVVFLKGRVYLIIGRTSL